LIDNLGEEEREILRKNVLAEQARRFTATGFKAFFELLFNLQLPEHQEYAITKSFDAYKNDKGIVIEMFRGAAKTTVFNTALACFLIGHFPERAGLLVQVGDNIAQDNSSTIAYHIEHNPGFKLVFPHIVPDRNRGWGAMGYCVMKSDLDYPDWIAELANKGTKDPTFIGLGYKSSAIIGKRPYWLILDDINDEKNTSSELEARKVETILTGTIFPAANQADFKVTIGTPWNENDAIHYCTARPEYFDHIKIPVYKEDGTPRWPEMYDDKKIDEQRALAGEIEFARMFLLDLEKTKGLVLKREWLHYWPNDQINEEWPVFIGVDFTSTEDPLKKAGDYFALAIGRVIPGKGMVITDGVYEKLSQAEAEGMVVAVASQYPTLQGVAVEAMFSGQNFYLNLLNNAEMRASGIVPIPVRFNKSKGYRFEKVMSPLFQRARVYLSDANNKFLTAFNKEWLNWQGDKLESLFHNDALDAVYALLAGAEGHVTPIANAPKMGNTNPFYQKKRQPNVWGSFARR
jgi:hypothetical protein